MKQLTFLTTFSAVIAGLIIFSPDTLRAATSVVIVNPPVALVPGQSAAVNVQFTKTADVAEKRIIFRVDLYDAATQAKVAGGITDNTGAGYTALSGSIVCDVPVPPNASGAYYFKATASPWSLNRAIVSNYKTYPTNGTFTYLWSGGGYGVTQTVNYLGKVAAPKPSGDTCYCSGLAFEACVIPFNAYNSTYGHNYIGNIKSTTQMETFRKIWYGVTDAEKLAARAIPEWGAGREITDFEEAQEGDFVQLWRNGTSGHNPMFVNWVRNGSGNITGVRYWATQVSTNGIGLNTEYFGTTSGINRNRFYLARLAKPRDQADYDWALAQSSSAASPSVVPSSISNWAQYEIAE